MRRWVAVAACTVAFAAACGSDGSGISAPASRRLQTDVDALRAAAASGNRTTTQAEVARLEETVRALRADGGLSEDAAARIDAALATVRDRTTLLPAPTTTTSTTTTTTRPERSEDEQHDSGHGRGHGRGHEKD